jgi:hypothetical protein
MSSMSDDEIIAAVEKTLGKRPQCVERLIGGANNVVARVGMGPETLLAKIYFTHPRDLRERLGTEFNTLTFLWASGIRCVPKPVAMDRNQHLGLYEFIPGKRLVSGQVGWNDVQQLGALLGEMWAVRNRPGAEKLPNASEAHFSLGKYRDHVAARLERVEAALAADSVTSPVRKLVRTQIRPGFEKLDRFVEKRAADYGIDPAVELAQNLRTISPADHGFHNVLRQRDGRLVFLDFEYAGWDQPAQMLANACLQPEVPLPPDFRKPFLKEMLKQLRGDDQLLYRLRLLFPLLSLKWSLIMLNEFLPVSDQRRSFAGANAEARRAAQLEKSQRQLDAALQAAANGFCLDDLIDELKPQPLL